MDPALSSLVLVRDRNVIREQPGQKNEYFDIPEHWAAFVGDDDRGIGVYVPSAERITTYRYKGGADSDCSYLAPITTFAIRPGLVFEYEAWLLLGTAEEIRAKIKEIEKS